MLLDMLVGFFLQIKYNEKRSSRLIYSTLILISSGILIIFAIGFS